MNFFPQTFRMPREPFPAWRYLQARPQHETSGIAHADQGQFFFWARNALYHALGALKISPGAQVLLPAYICRAAVEPFMAYGADVKFYAVSRHCAPDFADLERKIGPHTAAVLAVHYFGFPGEIQKFRGLCDRRRIFLIEDCAHILTGEANRQPLGSFGDASVFSYRKFLPMYDGAELRFRDASIRPAGICRKESALLQLKVAKNLLERSLDESPGALAKTITRLLEAARKIARGAQSLESRETAATVEQNYASFAVSLVNQAITRPSSWILRHSNVPAIIRKRRENFLFLQSLLAPVPALTHLAPQLPERVCPWIYPLIFDAIPNAHLRLRALGIPAVTWDGVRPDGISQREFPDADFLYDNLVFLPIHQNLSEAHLRMVAEAVQHVARGVESSAVPMSETMREPA